MNDNQYRQHCLEMLSKFSQLMTQQAQATSETDPLRELSAAFAALVDGSSDLYSAGPDLVSRLFASCPHLAPAFPRELLWFLGGDCLQLMPDEEITLYQQLDEQRWEASAKGELLDYHGVRANLLKLQ
jgi:hypothetical protein